MHQRLLHARERVCGPSAASSQCRGLQGARLAPLGLRAPDSARKTGAEAGSVGLIQLA